MNKKFFWSILSFVMIAIFSPVIMSCGGDDDDFGGNPNSQGGNSNTKKYVGVLDNKTGLRFASKSYPSSTFSEKRYVSYDEKGNIVKLLEKTRVGDKEAIFIDKNNIEEGEVNYKRKITLSYNSNGYISKIRFFGNSPELPGFTNEYEYDNRGHLVLAKCTLTVFSLKWEGDKLVSVTERYHGDDNSIRRINTYFYDNENYVNKYEQFVPCPISSNMNRSYVDDLLESLGLFGKGPKTLPTRKVYNFYKNDVLSSTSTENYSYEFNSDGAVSSVTTSYYSTYYKKNVSKQEQFFYDYATYVNK